jgi:hypothetical protein
MTKSQARRHSKNATSYARQFDTAKRHKASRIARHKRRMDRLATTRTARKAAKLGRYQTRHPWTVEGEGPWIVSDRPLTTLIRRANGWCERHRSALKASARSVKDGVEIWSTQLTGKEAEA